MAEVKNDEEGQQQHNSASSAKRKSDLVVPSSVSAEAEDEGKAEENGDHDSTPKKQKSEEPKGTKLGAGYEKTEEEEGDDEDGGDYKDDDEEGEEEDGDEHSSGEAAAVDRKGKGILIEDKKGKGQLVEKSDDDSSEEDDYFDSSSDFSDDPLAEVDLDNILPTRTRRRSFQPGVYISNDDLVKDDSDDSDA